VDIIQRDLLATPPSRGPSFDHYDIYVVNYPAHLSGNATIEDIVTSLHSQLEEAGITRHREIIFVCHSLGGIVTERLLLDYPIDASRAPFIYLLGTPLTGSAIANYVSFFGSNPVTHALNDGQDNDSLQLLENHWKTYASKVARYCGYEKKPLAGLSFVVDRLSATRGCNETLAIDADHNGIAKPSGPNALSYIGLVNALHDFPNSLAPAKNAPSPATVPSASDIAEKVVKRLPAAQPISKYIVQVAPENITVADAAAGTKSSDLSSPIHSGEPTSLVNLMFKDSPLLTAKRKERITNEIVAFAAYLKSLGIPIPSDVPPIAVKTRPDGTIYSLGLLPDRPERRYYYQDFAHWAKEASMFLRI
jgi:pimeloyl-ACP methyl ester carboxylesterase